MAEELSLAEQVAHLEAELVKLKTEIERTNKAWLWAINIVERKLIERIEKLY
jgi:hypothetical protein